MNREVKHRMGRSAGVPPEWTSVLAVIALRVADITLMRMGSDCPQRGLGPVCYA